LVWPLANTCDTTALAIAGEAMTTDAVTFLKKLDAEAKTSGWHFGPLVPGSGIYFVLDDHKEKVADVTYTRDARLIVHLRNLLPEIVAVLTAARRVVESDGLLSTVDDLANALGDLRGAVKRECEK
jgi:hypothetical protein